MLRSLLGIKGMDEVKNEIVGKTQLLFVIEPRNSDRHTRPLRGFFILRYRKKSDGAKSGL